MLIDTHHRLSSTPKQALHTNHKETQEQVPCQLQLHGARPITFLMRMVIGYRSDHLI